MRPHARPPWWPEDDGWPPGRADGRAWRGPPWWGDGRRRGAMRRGFGCLIVLLATLIVSIGVLVLWLLANLFGLAAEGPLATLARPAGLVVLVAGLIALVVGTRLARGVGGPLSELVDAAGRIEAADYSVRVSTRSRGPAELRGLGRAFNAMAARLESEDATRRRLLADVSHELRTPLAVIQGNLEALLDGVYSPDEAHLRPILDETRILQRLIDDLRTLSLAESGALPLHREPIDLGALLEDVASAHRTGAAAASIDLRVRAADDLPPIELDPMRMHQVISNLVDNAIKAVAGAGTITLLASRAGDEILVEVTDDGPGIPAELRSTLFDRFSKSATSRGSGLGLAIAQAIVGAHGGTISAGPGPGDSGTTFRIALPLT